MRFYEANAGRWSAGAIFEDSSADHGVILQVKDGDNGLAGDDMFLGVFGDPVLCSDALRDVRERARQGRLNYPVGDLPTPGRTLIEESTLAGIDPIHDAWLGEYRGNRWDFFYRSEPVADCAGTQNVSLIDLGRWRAEIERILRAASPHTYVLRDVDRYDWYGYIDDPDSLAGVMSVEHWISAGSIAHFGGLATDPSKTSRGVGTAIMTAALNNELASHDTVVFGMWVENDRARRIYERIGLHVGERMISCSPRPLRQH